MKIKVLLISHYAKLYGANRSLLDILDGLKRYPIEALVLLPHKGEISKKLDEMNINTIYYSFFNQFVYRWRSRNYFFQIIHDVRFFLIGIIFQIINKFIAKQIASNTCVNDLKLIYSNSSVITIGEDLSKILNVPHIHQIRELPREQFSLFPRLGIKWYIKRLQTSDLVIFNSYFTKKNFYNFSDRNNTKVIYNEVTKPKSDCSIKLNKDQFKIGIFGYLSKQKNQMEAIKALSLINAQVNVKLFIIGGGLNKDHIRSATLLNVNKNVEFIGYTDNVGDYYRELDIVLVCSNNEALGRVTIEAMLSGKCVIGKNSGATGEIIEHNVNGLLYDTVDELSNSIIYLYKNPIIRYELASNAYKIAVDKFNSGLPIKLIYEEIRILVDETI